MSSLTEYALGGIAVLVLLALAALALGALPMTAHAMEAHTGQYDADSISRMIDEGKCRQTQVVYCPKEKTVKFLCEIKRDLWGGVVVGVRDINHPVRVTGYAGRHSYWEANTKGCVGMPVDINFLKMAAP